MHHAHFAVAVGGDTFQSKEKDPSFECEARTDSQGTLCTDNKYVLFCAIIPVELKAHCMK